MPSVINCHDLEWQCCVTYLGGHGPVDTIPPHPSMVTHDPLPHHKSDRQGCQKEGERYDDKEGEEEGEEEEWATDPPNRLDTIIRAHKP
jgi:hypothetical protein